MTVGTPLDLDDPAFLTGDRTGTYRRLRDEAPALPIGPPDHRTWVLTRHSDVHAVLRAPAGRTQPAGLDAPPWMPDGPALRRLRANLAQTDGAHHGRLRKVLTPVFTVRQSEQLRAAATAETDREIAAVVARGGEFDAVADLAARVPRGVLRLLIGMPDEDWDDVLRDQLDFLMIFSPFPLDAAQQARLDEVARSYLDYFDGLLGRAGEPTPMVARLLAAEAAGELSRDEVLSLMHTVLDAGFETTRTSIANTVQLLAEQPGLLERLRHDPSTVAATAEEILRFRPPVEVMPRFVGEDHVADDGTIVPAGSPTLCVVASANHDERAFADPDRIDPGRADLGRSMTFGGGLHHCIGAPIARIQLQEALAGLARNFGRIEVTDPDRVARHPSLIFPSLVSLPVRGRP